MRVALLRTDGLAKILSPTRVARILDAILPSKQLFVVSYDQEKAYDSVQAYTIKASLERFNLPEDFIRFVAIGSGESNKLF